MRVTPLRLFTRTKNLGGQMREGEETTFRPAALFTKAICGAAASLTLSRQSRSLTPADYVDSEEHILKPDERNP